jgi:hypothetical protein
VHGFDAVAVEVDHRSAVVVLFRVSKAWLSVDLAAGFQSGDEKLADSLSRRGGERDMSGASRDTIRQVREELQRGKRQAVLPWPFF